MRTKLSPAEFELYRAVDETLHYLWDPIEVSGCPQARDEYHSYLPQVFGLVRDNASEQAIADYLGKVATERMGLSANAKNDMDIALVLTDCAGQRGQV